MDGCSEYILRTFLWKACDY